MATLKSFELLGNKKSFANWISNLSPCDSPFTSMIGKEAIDQTQYSWQTDALAPATIEAFEEGSQAVSQPKAATEVITNFTSILRTVASVSDTANALNLYGRQKELQYQLAKAGKEILRDLEYMNLHQVNGNAGATNRASTFAGFEGLVAGIGVSESDTGAVVHKPAYVSNNSIDKNDIFDITTNLYLTSSKADKIMFHPKYAASFSAYISNDADAPNTYRMFDELGTTFNAQVKTIKDPLGKIWTLIPNRFMPENKVYFFHESDWTQTILREPSTIKLAKKGSNQQYAVEMEVGLRHRHPYASGILELTTVVAHNTMTPSRVVFTSSVKDSQAVRSDTSIDGVGEGGHEVTFHTSNPDILDFEFESVITPSSGRAANKLLAGDKAGIVNIWSVFKGVRSKVTQITVVNPSIELVVDDADPSVNQDINLTATVKKANGTAAGNDITVKWYVETPTGLDLQSISSVTTAGVATVKGRVLSGNQNLLQATLNGATSNKVYLNYVPAVGSLVDFILTPNTIDIGGFSDLSVKVLDETGSPMIGFNVNWMSNDLAIARPRTATSVTDDQGIARVGLQGVSKGTTSVYASVDGVESDSAVCHVGHNASLDFEMTPNPTVFGESTKFYGSIKGQDGLGIPAVEFVIRSDVGSPPMRLDVTTDGDGDFSEDFTFTNNSDQEITVEIPSLNIVRKETLRITDLVGIGELNAAEVLTQPVQIGGKSIVRVVLNEASGLPLKDEEVLWTVTPASVVTPNATVTRTDLNGMSSIEVTGISKGVGEIVYRCKNKNSHKATFLVGQGTDLEFTHSPLKPLSNQEVTFTGIVKRSDNGDPIRNAEVTLHCNPSASYFPNVKLVTDAQGKVEYKTIFISEENFVVTASAPTLDVSSTTTVEVQPISGAGDIKYVHSISGHTVRHTHSIPTDLPVTLYTTQHGGLPALNMKMECLDLDPSIATSIVPNVTTNTEGKIFFHIRGLKAGIARFRVRAIGAIANFIDFEVTIASPKLNVTISPSSVGGGKRVEFSADLKDTYDNWVPGAKIRWEYPHNMLAHAGQLETQETDQFGRVYYDRVAALWGNHTIRAVLENDPLVKSRDYSLYIHM